MTDVFVPDTTLDDSAKSEWWRGLLAAPRALSAPWQSLLISVVGWSVYFVAADRRPLNYDSLGYWQLSEKLSTPVSFWNHEDDLRGYSWPWAIRLARTVIRPVTTDPEIVARAISLFVFPTLLCIAVPKLASRLSPTARLTVPRILLLNVLFFFGWRHDAFYTLSDGPALLAMTLGILLVISRPGLKMAMLAGVLLGLAANARPAYLLSAGAAIGLVFLVERGGKQILKCSAMMTLGILLALVPQSIANAENHGTFSPFPVGSGNLSQMQLRFGLQMYRYDTYVGDLDVFGGPSVIYQTPELRRYITESFPEGGPEFRDFISIVADRPLDLIDAYSRHLLSGLDVRFAGTYIENFDVPWFVPVVNFALLSLAILSIARRRVRHRKVRWRGPGTYVLALGVIACGPALLGATEVRFLLPIHLALLAFFALDFDRSDIPDTVVERASYGIALIALVVGWSLLADGTLDSRCSLQGEPACPIYINVDA